MKCSPSKLQARFIVFFICKMLLKYFFYIFRKIFGLPYEYSRFSIKVGAPIFVYSTDSTNIFGIFQAITELSSTPMDPKAFVINGMCSLPCQLRVECALSAPPINYYDPDIRNILAGSNFGGTMKLEVTTAMCELFASRAGIIASVDNAVGYYKAPFQFSEDVKTIPAYLRSEAIKLIKRR